MHCKSEHFQETTFRLSYTHQKMLSTSSRQLHLLCFLKPQNLPCQTFKVHPLQCRRKAIFLGFRLGLLVSVFCWIGTLFSCWIEKFHVQNEFIAKLSSTLVKCLDWSFHCITFSWCFKARRRTIHEIMLRDVADYWLSVKLHGSIFAISFGEQYTWGRSSVTNIDQTLKLITVFFTGCNRLFKSWLPLANWKVSHVHVSSKTCQNVFQDELAIDDKLWFIVDASIHTTAMAFRIVSFALLITFFENISRDQCNRKLTTLLGMEYVVQILTFISISNCELSNEKIFHNPQIRLIINQKPTSKNIENFRNFITVQAQPESSSGGSWMKPKCSESCRFFWLAGSGLLIFLFSFCSMELYTLKSCSFRFASLNFEIL